LLQAGDSIYFAVNGEADFDFDASEITWKIRASFAP
jgi:hypothetical protein